MFAMFATRLTKVFPTAQLAGCWVAESLGRASSIKHNMRQFGDRTGNCNSQHKVWRTEREMRWTAGQRRGWRMVGLATEYLHSLCLYLPSVTYCHASHVTCDDVARAPDAKSANHLDHSLLWEEGGIFWLLKVHLLQIQQVLVSNEGNDECFCWDELACAVQGVATVKSQNLPSEP